MCQVLSGLGLNTMPRGQKDFARAAIAVLSGFASPDGDSQARAITTRTDRQTHPPSIKRRTHEHDGEDHRDGKVQIRPWTIVVLSHLTPPLSNNHNIVL
jgi:hypothetical protein